MVKIGTLLGQKRRKLITDLAFIYPIYEVNILHKIIFVFLYLRISVLFYGFCILLSRRTQETTMFATLTYQILIFSLVRSYSIHEYFLFIPFSTDKDENAVSAALGYTAHLISMIYYFLDVPLRYPIRFKCSRSEIIDNFQTVIPDKMYSFLHSIDNFNEKIYL